MIARLDNLRKHPVVFQHLTGVPVAAFDELAAAVVPAAEAAHRQTLDRPNRKRAVGGGDTFDLTTADQLLLAVIWLRQYPTNEVLGFLFGVSDSTASRARARCVPVLERARLAVESDTPKRNPSTSLVGYWRSQMTANRS